MQNTEKRRCGFLVHSYLTDVFPAAILFSPLTRLSCLRVGKALNRRITSGRGPRVKSDV